MLPRAPRCPRPVFPKVLNHYFELETVERIQANIARHDFELPVTDHGEIDDDLIERHARLIVDTRAILLEADNVSKA